MVDVLGSYNNELKDRIAKLIGKAETRRVLTSIQMAACHKDHEVGGCLEILLF